MALRRLLLYPCLSFAVLSSFGQDSRHRPSEASQLQNGIALLAQKRYAEARREFIRVTRRDSNSVQGYFYLGLVEVNLGNPQNAEKSFRRALQLEPRSVSTLYNLGVLLLQQNRAGEAIVYLERVYQIDPRSAELTVNLIRAHLDLGQHSAASQVAELANGRFENAPEFHLAAGKLFLSHGVIAQARASLEKANRLLPLEPEILLPLAAVCLEEKDAGRARELLASIAGSAEHTADYHYLLGQICFLSNQKEQALKEISEAIRLNGRNPSYLLTLARYFQKYGDQRQAVETLEKAARLDPRNPQIPYSAAVSYFIVDDYGAAAQFLDRALELDPGFDRAIFLLGCIRAALAKFEEAEKLLNQAIKLKPDNPFYYCMYGMLLVTENRLPDALGYFEKTLALNPSYALSHYHIGRILLRLGDPEKARFELEKAVALQPEQPEAWYLLGQTYRKLGMPEKAEEALLTFKKYRHFEQTDRQEMLKQVHELVQNQP